MAEIHFFSEGISFKVPFPRKTTTWLQKIAKSEKRKIDSLTYIFCSEEYLLSLNKKYLRHSTYTDIISFDFSERGGSIQGEIYISIPRVKENATTFSQPFEQELKRVISHGLLHFIGYRDKSKEEKVQMRLKEEACLSLWK